ncbi:hypothetical protein [Algibacter luteus]|uniref:Uncharacterized protein n=1 Tax=Algibacter luteus TaxID=1178825 RepID=A0A1M6DA75_9FLAO|nr:hypothetical protein [Algibacter luteus]SHI70134.1 hypothetical protein SAMN05216261_1442 [Algibacter luteus]
MKIKLNNILFYGIIIQIIATQGIATFNFFKMFGHWELKTILHPLSFFLILGIFSIKAIKRVAITPLDLLFFLYLGATSIFLFFNVDSLKEGYLGFRDVYMLFVLIFIYNQIYLTRKQWNFMLKFLFYLIIVNLFFVALTYILGPEKYMETLTGRFIWDMDPDYKFKITNFAGTKFWRTPGIVGEAGSLAYFSLLTFVLMDMDEKYKVKKYFALALTFLCFTRNAYLVILLYIIIKFAFQKKNFVKIYLILKYSIPFIVLVVIYVAQLKLLSVKSVYYRINHWINDINVPYNIFYGGAVGKSGAAVRGEGFAAILDNYYLLMLFSIGIIGILLMILFIYEKARPYRNLSIFCISLSITAIFIVLTHGIPFLVLFPLLFIKKDFEND